MVLRVWRRHMPVISNAKLCCAFPSPTPSALLKSSACWSKMSGQCFVVGCPNNRKRRSSDAGSGDAKVFFHKLPADEPRRSQWLQAVRLREVEGKIAASAAVCSQHFRRSDYERDPSLSQSFGLAHKFPRLSRSAVPSMAPSSEERNVSTLHHETSEAMVSVLDTPSTSSTRNRNEATSEDTEVQTGPADSRVTAAASCSVGRDKGVQVIFRGKNVEVQVNTLLREQCDKEVQVDLPYVRAVSTPVKRPRHASEEEPSHLLPSPNVSPNVSPVGARDRSDDTYEPNNSTMTQDTEGGSSEAEDGAASEASEYYLVSHVSLLMLLQVCFKCLFSPCVVALSFTGTFVKACVKCPHDRTHTRVWTSQPKVGRKAKGNIDLAAAVLFAGASPARILRVLTLMNVQAFSERTFFDYQKAYLLPAVNTVWSEQQEQLLEILRTADVELCGDGRCDSPGFSAKFLTYSFHCPQMKRIVHTEQVQVGESDAVKSSVNMEKEGLIRGLAFFSDVAVTIKSLTTDRHSGIKKHMRQHHSTIVHYFDVWHVAKGIRKKLLAASKKRGCSDIGKWTQSITNYMYACASASEGKGDLLVAMWRSLLNHIVNIHSGHGEVFPRCLHRDLEDRAWLSVDSPAYNELKSILTTALLLKDIQQLSPEIQTYGLESFHSVLNQFAPKSAAFTYEGMKARTLIAALHFNENGDRAQAETRDGNPMWHLKTSKARRGAEFVSPLKTAVTFEYVQDLHNKVLQLCELYPTFAEALQQLPSKVPPAFTPEQRQDKDVVAARQVARFSKP